MPLADSAVETTGAAVSPEEVHRLARIARLALTDDEAETHADDLNRFLDYARRLDDVDTTGVEPMAVGGPTAPQHRRSDKAARPLSQEDALEDAEGGGSLFRLPGERETDQSEAE